MSIVKYINEIIEVYFFSSNPSIESRSRGRP